MGSENWCGQEMRVPVGVKDSWIGKAAGKIGVGGQKVEYLRFFCRCYTLYTSYTR